MHSCRIAARERPRSLFDKPCITLRQRNIEAFLLLTCVLKLSFLSIHTPSHRRHVLGLTIVLLGSLSVSFDSLWVFSKCISSDLESSKAITLFFAQLKAVTVMSLSILTFCFTFLFETKIDISSMYDIVEIDLYCCLSLSKRGCKYIKKRIGDISDSYGMPVSIDVMSSLSLSKASEICRFDMKSFVYAIILSEIPSDFIVFNNLVLKTLSKASLTSSIKHVDFSPCDCAF
jgi:hypothetical protein